MTTREEWLVSAAGKIWPLLQQVSPLQLPVVRMSVGWPLGRKKMGGKGSHAIGQCFSHLSSKDKTNEIFISPELDSPTRVLDVLTHELIHAFVGLDQKHSGEFKRVAKAVGLTGKMTATEAGPELVMRLNHFAELLGPYPHASLGAGVGLAPKQTTRLIKLTCPDCGYTIRTTQKWIDAGYPTCPCGAGFGQPVNEE